MGAAQRQRSLNSPGMARQNSFPGQEGGFPGPPSPGHASFGGNGMGGIVGPVVTGNPVGPTQNVMFGAQNTQQQLQRIQRQPSIPQGAQHLPGELYGGCKCVEIKMR